MLIGRTSTSRSAVKKEKADNQKRKTGEIILLKDLAPRTEAKGGSGKIVFGAGSDALFESEEENKAKRKK